MKKAMIITTEGYVKLLIPDHHRACSQGYVLEHIVVAERKYNRLITREEAVHHIDRNKSNNDPDNLLVMSHAEHHRLHAAERKGPRNKRRKKHFESVSSGKDLVSFKGVPKEKLPRGYYYLRSEVKVRKTKKMKENA